ncbi:uncharacterized protein LOC142338014 [Convolutriloba macropyga]|uniref:uncharacterized protein LOC142338014 n=1 Tax=Convolutriloba macropyga TaxID=536237 RepID=UPI003F528533
MSSGGVAVISPSTHHSINPESSTNFENGQFDTAELENNENISNAENECLPQNPAEQSRKENGGLNSILNDSDSEDSDQGENQKNSENKEEKKLRALTEKQMEAEKLRLHSESQRILRVGALKLPKQLSTKSKASLAEFVKPESKIGSLIAKQNSAPVGLTSRKSNRQFACLSSQPVEIQTTEKKSTENNVQSTLTSAAAKLRAQKLERLLGKPLPDLKKDTTATNVNKENNILEINGKADRKSGSNDEIVLVKSSRDIQKEKLMERFTQHSQKRKPKPVVTRNSPLTLAASAIDERVLSQMMMQSLEDAKKNSAIQSAVSSGTTGKDGGKVAVSGVVESSQELPPGRGRHLLRNKLKNCMFDMMRQKHEARCEMFEQEKREYNERMGIEEGDENGANKIGDESEDEDFEPPSRGEASDDQDEGDSGSDVGSDVNGEAGETVDDDENDDEEEERRERNLLIEDEAEEDNDEQDEGDGVDDIDVHDDGNQDSKIKRQADKRNFHLPLRSEKSSDGQNNETAFSDASSFFPLAQVPRCEESNITSVNMTACNNTMGLDDSIFRPVLNRTDSSRTAGSRKSADGDDSESIFSQSNLFDEDGFIRTERSSRHDDKLEKERDNWIKCLLESSSNVSTPAPSTNTPVTDSSSKNNPMLNAVSNDITCDEEVSKLIADCGNEANDGTKTDVTKFRPSSGENAIFDPEDIGFLCSGKFASQNSQENNESSQGAVRTEKTSNQTANGPKSVVPHPSNSGSNPSSSLDELAMLCSAPFTNNAQSQVKGAQTSSQASQSSRYQSSPLDDAITVSRVSATGRLESPAFSAVDPNSPIAAQALARAFELPAEYSPAEPDNDQNDDDDEDEILKTAKKKARTPKTQKQSQRKSRILSDSESEPEIEENPLAINNKEFDNDVVSKAAGNDVMKDLIRAKKEKGVDELSVFDGGNSVKLFSESTASEIDVSDTKGELQGTGQKGSMDMRKDEESNFDEGSQQGGKAEQQTGSRKLRRVVLDEDDEDDDDDDEGSEADDEYGEGDEEELTRASFSRTLSHSVNNLPT